MILSRIGSIISFLFMISLGKTFLQPSKMSTIGNENSCITAKSSEIENNIQEFKNVFELMLRNPSTNSPFNLGLSMLSESLPLKSLIGPEYDIVETNDTFKILTDLPGFDKDNIEVEVTGKQVTISATKSSELREDTDSYHRIGRTFGRVKRVIILPDNTKEQDGQAEYNDGVLSLTFPKNKISALVSKKIEIKLRDNQAGKVKIH